MKIMAKAMLLISLSMVVSACVQHPRGESYRYSSYSTLQKTQQQSNKSHHPRKVEVYGEMDIGVGYQRTKISY